MIVKVFLNILLTAVLTALSSKLIILLFEKYAYGYKFMRVFRSLVMTICQMFYHAVVKILCTYHSLTHRLMVMKLIGFILSLWNIIFSTCDMFYLNYKQLFLVFFIKLF